MSMTEIQPSAKPTIASDPDLDLDLDLANGQLEAATAQERVRWALRTFGKSLVLSTSFGIQSAVMLHLVTREVPEIPVIFIDTGYLFPETYRFAEALRERLQLNLKIFVPARTAAFQEAIHGRLWEQGKAGLQRYGQINKVEPMNRALRELGARAWLAGLRREQASTRSDLRVLHLQNRTFKIHPIADWSSRQVYHYLQAFDLPYHPLWEQGYVSVGDVHSTRRLTDELTEEQTRFNGVKRECGLHELSGNIDYQI